MGIIMLQCEKQYSWNNPHVMCAGAKKAATGIRGEVRAAVSPAATAAGRDGCHESKVFLNTYLYFLHTKSH